jgi:excisionase family DNA binding protein
VDDPKSAELLSPRQVADALGVSESSIKRWSDDGLMATHKTAGGHRKLARADVLRFVREQGYDVGKPELLGLARVPRQPFVDRAVQDQLVTALVDGDGEAIRRLLVALVVRGEPLTAVFDELLAAALHEIGNQWERGGVRVFEEHRAIELVHRALHEIRQLLTRRLPARRPAAIVATLSGDPYTVAITMAELTLADAGWAVTDLGANNPAHTLVEAIASLRPRLVCIGINWIGELEPFAAAYASIDAAARSERAALVIGGARTTPELRARIHYATCCANMRELVDFASSLVPDAGGRATRPRATRP